MPPTVRRSPKTTPQTPHSSHRTGSRCRLAHTGIIGGYVLSAVGCPPTSSALPSIEASGVFVYAGRFQPPARYPVLWPLLTSQGISSLGSPQVRTRCFPTRPPHLPPRLNLTASLCCASSPHHVGLSIRFLFIGPPVSSSLPPPGWLPFRSWLQVVVISHFHVSVLLQGTCTPFTTRPCWAHTKCRKILALTRQIFSTNVGKRDIHHEAI